MQFFGSWAPVPILLHFLASALAQLEPNGLSVSMNMENELGASMAEGNQIQARQAQQCADPGWVITCPDRARPCAPPGAACCGPASYYWPETQQCCPGGRICPTGTACCGAVCCLAGGTCVAGNRCVLTSAVTETRTSATTTRLTSTRTTASTGTTEVTVSASSETGTTEATISATSSSSETEACTIEVDKRAILPTKTIPYKETYTTLPNSNRKVCLDNRELMQSMCKGIEKRRGCTSNSMKLKYRPDLANTNRPKMCPDGFCAPQNVPCPPGDSSGACNPYSHFMDIPAGRTGVKWRLTCDEFPFARSLEGGSGTSICIPGWQNSFQGYMLRGLMRDVGAGNDYIVQITGWDCKTGKPRQGSAQNCGLNAGTAMKRENLGGESLSQDDFFSNITESGENGLMMFLGDVSPGSYTFNLSIAAGNLSAFLAVDGDGTTIDSSTGGGGGILDAGPNPHVVTVQVAEPAYDVSLWALTRASQVGVEYNVTYSATPPSLSGAERKCLPIGVDGGGLLLLVAGVLVGAVGGVLLW